MYSSVNHEIIDCINQSEVLATKLSPAQLQKFRDAAVSLPPEGQSQLIQKLKAEAEIMQKAQAEDQKNLEQYAQNIQQKVKQIKKETEKNSRKNELSEAENLLTTISI